MMLTAPFMPPAAASRMQGTGDVAASRARFLEKRPGNLEYLLEKRYGWMNEFIGDDDVGIEIGCGAGLSKQYIRSHRLELTDYADFDWLDRKVDALHLPYADASLDFIIESNVIHHLARPSRFLFEAHRVLKRGGIFLVSVPYENLIRRVRAPVNGEGRGFVVRPVAREERGPAPPGSTFFQYFYRPEEFRRALKQHRFEVVPIIPRGNADQFGAKQRRDNRINREAILGHDDFGNA